MGQRVNLDAMILREDFGRQAETVDIGSSISDFRLDYLKSDSPIRLQLRKPDFQRETNHWSPEQIATFVASFLDNEVIPGIILWRSESHIFVIDGGHRPSALRAWIENDYGDGAISIGFYGGEISGVQRRAAKLARTMIENRVGRYSDLGALVGKTTGGTQSQLVRAGRMYTRALPLQWVSGAPNVAETSFFKINTQGTPLDETEEMLIRNRAKPVAIAARAVLRSGTGNKYWSAFSSEKQVQIESLARQLFQLLFEPEAQNPIKTGDVPLGGSVSPVEALSWLIDFITVAGDREQQKVKAIAQYQDDATGDGTVQVLRNSLEIANTITGGSSGSLGLHPAIYFYNERGKQSRFLLLGMTYLIAEIIKNNNRSWLKRFTGVRSKVEAFLVESKSMIGAILQNLNKASRVPKMRDLFKFLVNDFHEGKNVTPESVFEQLGLAGQVIAVRAKQVSTKVTDNTKSIIALRDSISSGVKCPVCGGLLDPGKSVSYDHKTRKREQGTGDVENVQRTHPFCNTGFKS